VNQAGQEPPAQTNSIPVATNPVDRMAYARRISEGLSTRPTTPPTLLSVMPRTHARATRDGQVRIAIFQKMFVWSNKREDFLVSETVVTDRVSQTIRLLLVMFVHAT